MKRFIFGALLLICTVIPGRGYADESKIAFVNAQEVLGGAKEGMRLRQLLDDFVKARQTVIDLDEKELTRLNEDFEKNRAILSPEAVRTRQEDIDKAVSRYREKVTGLQKEVQEKRISALSEFNQKLEQAIKEIAEKEGYTLVLDENPERGLVLYAKSTDDITQKVVAAMDRLFSQKKTDEAKEK